MSEQQAQKPAAPNREPSAVGRGWKRKNTLHSAAFGEAEKVAVQGISELSCVDKKDATIRLELKNQL